VSQRVPVGAEKEMMRLDLVHRETLVSPCHHAMGVQVISEWIFTEAISLLANEIFGLARNIDLLGEDQILRPLDNLLVGISRIVGAEWCVANKAFKEDGAQRPPITFFPVSFHEENFGCNLSKDSIRDIMFKQMFAYVVWCSDSRIRLVQKFSQEGANISKSSNLQAFFG